MFQPLGRSAVRKAMGPSADPPMPRITTSSYLPRAAAENFVTCSSSGRSIGKSRNPTEPVARSESNAIFASANCLPAALHAVGSIPPGEIIMLE